VLLFIVQKEDIRASFANYGENHALDYKTKFRTRMEIICTKYLKKKNATLCHFVSI
jgi:uncharacterized HAD superfamily protein